ncbi:nucleotidyltransferase family protein [Salibaculum sp.]|uniref:nucleotidyltransferase family protein n=1 Tax=Salibaculum sp. TaxID=2855480 RepID=UPI002B45DE1F|nr:nucleotidyltransferase family protein [Salibaculum sp.]HKL70527.1 nucleotidyltransferase family protein [Salibaculum sp.]
MTAAILIPAAGASSRMAGRDKLLELVDGQPLLRRLVTLCLPHGPVFVTLPGADHPRAQVLPRAANTVAVPDWQTGMSASLRAGNTTIPGAHDLMILPADMPEITGNDIARMIAARTEAPGALIWQAATMDGTPGHPVLFAAKLRDEFAGLSGDAGARPILAAHAGRRHLVPLPGLHARLDLDTPEDWARWRESRR